MKMTKAQSVSLMNAVAILLSYISKFSKPFQFIHALSGFESAAADIYAEMEECLKQGRDVDEFIVKLQEKIEVVVFKESQVNMLRAYHLCMWLDDMITYEDVAGRKLSIYNLVPLRAFSYVAIDTLNDNCTETGICIHPKLPIFKSFSIMDDGTEKEKTMSCRDAFTGMNGELRKISYCKWSSEYIVHNVIIPYEYVEKDERSAKGNLRIGFIPISDKTDLIVPDYKIVKDGKYQMNKMYIDHPRHEEVIHTRLRHGLELACRNKADIVFSPEMLGTDQTEKQQGNYNEFVRQVYDEAVMNDHKPPMITVVPTRWCRGINSASIVYRDGRILGRPVRHILQ